MPSWLQPVVGRVAIAEGDALAVLASIPDACVDAVVCDPPAGISFMGKAWDHDKGGRDAWIAWLSEVMAEALRVTKPGGHALVWALPRTSHWTGMAIETAGWEVRDRVTHLHGQRQGFPKGQNIGKAIDRKLGREREVVGTKLGTPGYSLAPSKGHLFGDGFGGAGDPEREAEITVPGSEEARQWEGWNTALKPAAEDWWLARKPFKGSTVDNVLAHGTGGLHIDACRIGTSKDVPASQSETRAIYGTYNGGEPDRGGMNPHVGRWPANVVLDEAAAAELDAQSGVSTSLGGSRGGNRVLAYGMGAQPDFKPGFGDTGGASRFYYVAKASAKERPKVDGVAHSTVKPLALMRWLVRLVTPPGGLVLDPFAGSGTTGEAALLEGMRCYLVEREHDYIKLIEARIARSVPHEEEEEVAI